MCRSAYVCRCICPFIYVCPAVPACLSVCLSVCPYVCLSVCLSVCQCLSTSLSTGGLCLLAIFYSSHLSLCSLLAGLVSTLLLAGRDLHVNFVVFGFSARTVFAICTSLDECTHAHAQTHTHAHTHIQVTPVPSVSNHTTPRTVGPLPNTLTFNVQGLEPDTQYSVVAVGTYQNVSGFTDELEVTPGESIMIRTEGNFELVKCSFLQA